MAFFSFPLMGYYTIFAMRSYRKRAGFSPGHLKNCKSPAFDHKKRDFGRITPFVFLFHLLWLL
ncbi:MAG: hypothetical protein CSA81_02335 [Acidobacteria bacterium]|nr:MAG: hypothetical protein CSA81_02335 [Acidobacteriota bacterium]